MKKICLVIQFLVCLNLFSQNYCIIDTAYNCKIINQKLENILTDFFNYEDSLWGYNQEKSTFQISFFYLKTFDIIQSDSIIDLTPMIAISSGINENLYTFYFDPKEVITDKYYISYFNNKKIVFQIENEINSKIDCFLKIENPVFIKRYEYPKNVNNGVFLSSCNTLWYLTFNSECDIIETSYTFN